MRYIERLNWDSIFFELEIGKIDYSNKFHESYIYEINKSKYDLIYIYNSINNSYSKLLNSQLVDTKFNFSKILNAEDTFFIDHNIAFFNSNIPSKSIIDLCIASGEYSRFKLDLNFKSDAFLNLYTAWITNALKRIKHEKIIIYSIKNKIVGLLILSFKVQFSVIEILAVDKEYRGKGIAKKLINTACKETILNNFKEIRVATQKKNLPSSKLYTSCGFELFEVVDIYHLWL